METARWKDSLLLAAAAVVLFGANLGGYDVWAPDEPRFAEVAREMRVSGDYLVPRVNGETYLEKPPLLFWAITLASLPFPEVDALSARVPSAVAGTATSVLVYLLALRLFSRRAAFWAGIVFMTSVSGWWQARTGQIDMLLTACTTASLYGLCRWDQERRRRWLLLVYGAVAAGMLAKGPPALVCPFLFILFYYRRDKAARKATRWPWGLGAALAVTALWYVPARMAGADTAAEALGSGMADNLFRNTVGRIFMGVSKAQWPWYYLKTIPLGLLPWTVLLPWTLSWVWQRRRSDAGVRLLWFWVVPAFIFFSLCVGKRAIYILPLFPAFALLIAASMVDLIDSAREKWRVRSGLAWGALLVLLGIAPAALPWTEYAEVFGAKTMTAMALIIAAGLFALVWSLRDRGRCIHLSIAFSATLLWLTTAWLVLPQINPYKSARSFCASVRQIVDRGVEFRLYSVGFTREEYIFYAKHFHETVFSDLSAFLHLEPKAVLAARRLVERVVEDVPLENLAAPTAEEVEALHTAIRDALATADLGERGFIADYEAALRTEVQDFAERFESGTPAFMFVREEDWRWLLPLYGHSGYHVVRHQPVGSRQVLLVANDAGHALLETRKKA